MDSRQVKTIDHMEAIQLDTLEGAVFIKLVTRHQMDNLLMATSGKSFLQRYDGTQIFRDNACSGRSKHRDLEFLTSPWKWEMNE
jgi:hypothetical protein